VWSASLGHGFVGCVKDLSVNTNTHNLVAAAHQQDVGKTNINY
jgi:hypothetical protein